MNKINFFIIVFFLSGQILFAQTIEAEAQLKTQSVDSVDGWKKGGTLSFNISQTSLTNWSAGGQSSVAVNSLVSLFLNYKKGNSLLENNLDIGYGSMKQGEGEEWWKTDDKIDFTSKYGYKMKKHLFIAVLVNVKTQMNDGYNYPDDSTLVSKFMSPGYMLGALGLDYKPGKNFGAFVSPITSKSTFVLDQVLADAGAYGVDAAMYDNLGVLVTEGKNSRTEFGGYLRMFYHKNLMKNIDLTTKLELFSNYIENPQNIDVNWDVLLSMKVNKYISATIATTLVYDHDIDIQFDTADDGTPIVGPRTQFKEVLQLGINFKF